MNDEVSFPRKWEFIFSSLDSQLCQAEFISASRYKDTDKAKMPTRAKRTDEVNKFGMTRLNC